MHRAPAFMACCLVFAVTLAVTFSLPLRPKGADTLPGRLGAATFACVGNDDLSRIAWVHRQATTSGIPYWLTVTKDGKHLVSTWGPAPAWVGSLALASLGRGDVVTEVELLRLARRAAACAVALSAATLCLALLRWLPPSRALLWALATAFSFAGVGTLGQALWQQTVALPLLVAALASIAWEDRRWPLLLTPAFLAALVLTRPAEIVLALPIAALWLFRVRARASLRALVLALGLAVAASLPMVVWNLWYFDVPLFTGQWEKNHLGSLQQVFVALLGLLVSPGRGAVWFAPVLVVALVLGAMKVWKARALAGSDLILCAVAGQTVFVACFVMWWGGYVSFGPRLLAVPFWAIVVWLAESSVRLSRGGARVVHAALAITAMVGLAGGVWFDPAKWYHTGDDARRLWQVVDSPIPALWHIPQSAFVDSLEQGPFIYCKDRVALAPVPTGS